MQKVVIMAKPQAGALALVDRPLPPLGRSDALLRIRAAGICGTDLHIVKWNSWAAGSYRPPVALGHEFCAEVVETGADVTDVKLGDRVVAETHLSCGVCRQCRANRRHTCDNLQVFSRLNRGGFADLSVVPAALLRRVPQGVSDAAATLMEPLGIALRTVMTANIPGQRLLVIGCGPIGLLTIVAARHFGARHIVACDIVPERLDLARKLGADESFDVSHQPLTEWVPPSGASDAVDVAVDTSGHPAAIGDALSLIVTGGKLILAGLPEEPVSLDLTRHVILREVAIIGLYGRLIDETWLQAERLLTTPGFDLRPLLTHVFSLADYRAAFDTALSGRSGKVIFCMDSETASAR